MKRFLMFILAVTAAFILCACEDINVSEMAEKSPVVPDAPSKMPVELQNLIPYFDEETGKYGYCTIDGEEKIEPQFDRAEFFNGKRLAAVGVGEGWEERKYGFINEAGEFIIEPEYDFVYPFGKNGLAAVAYETDTVDEEKWGFVSETGDVVFEAIYDEIYNPVIYDVIAGKVEDHFFDKNGLVVIRLGEKKALANEKGEFLTEFSFDYIGEFAENGLAPMSIDDKCGYINTNGEIVIEPQFEIAYGFEENGYAFVMFETDKWSFIDETGKFVSDVVLDEYANFTENGLAAKTVDGKIGFININGEFVIEPKFDEVTVFFENGLAFAKEGDYQTGKWGIINESGEYVTEPIFDEIYHFSNAADMAVVVIDNKYGYVDGNGEIVIEPRFHYADEFDEAGMARISLDGKMGVINKAGELIIPAKFNEIYNFGDTDYSIIRIGEWDNGDYGVIDRNGNYTVDPQPLHINNVYDGGIAEVVTYDDHGYVKRIDFIKGNEIIRP